VEITEGIIRIVILSETLQAEQKRFLKVLVEG
jgi:hypothetical protein